VLHKSATIRHALKAQEAGVDLIEVVVRTVCPQLLFALNNCLPVSTNTIPQGYEASIAGGQPGDEVGSWVMLPKAASLLKVPVIASGASATGRQLAAALAMGAHGITMATAFLATVEAPIHASIKEALASDAVDERSTTVVMSSLNNATRVFKNKVSLEMNKIEKTTPGDFESIGKLASGLRTKAMWKENGDVQSSMWSAGQSAGLIHDVPTCKVLIERIVADAEIQLTKGAALISKM
jgi:NAD(P)H-dependent flavin oxidoreductase YrpB (nitropropane dioxygenase family)